VISDWGKFTGEMERMLKQRSYPNRKRLKSQWQIKKWFDWKN
jgi:Ser/Thr protein kinase RdoA (MazF antagonist)